MREDRGQSDGFGVLCPLELKAVVQYKPFSEQFIALSGKERGTPTWTFLPPHVHVAVH
jgi:hypothetical protein